MCAEFETHGPNFHKHEKNHAAHGTPRLFATYQRGSSGSGQESLTSCSDPRPRAPRRARRTSRAWSHRPASRGDRGSNDGQWAGGADGRKGEASSAASRGEKKKRGRETGSEEPEVALTEWRDHLDTGARGRRRGGCRRGGSFLRPGEQAGRRGVNLAHRHRPLHFSRSLLRLLRSLAFRVLNCGCSAPGGVAALWTSWPRCALQCARFTSNG